MSRPTEWAPTAPGDGWVPTIMMVEEHSARAWEQIQAGGRLCRPVTVVDRAPAGFDRVMLLVGLLGAVLGSLLTVAAIGWSR